MVQLREVRTPRFVRIGSDGMTLRGLRADAKLTAVGRGHDMGRFVDGRAYCRLCGMGVQVMAHIPANGIDIGGEAVALNCKGS